ncbi:MAG: hypothetical protein R3A52_22560 [Polyangiales bacterium]
MKTTLGACLALALASFGCSSSQDSSRPTTPEPSPMESTQQMTREDNSRSSGGMGGIDTTTSPGVSDAGMYDPNASQTSMGDGGVGMGMGDGGMSPMGMGDGGVGTSMGTPMGAGDGGMSSTSTGTGTGVGTGMGMSDAGTRRRTR